MKEILSGIWFLSHFTNREPCPIELVKSRLSELEESKWKSTTEAKSNLRLDRQVKSELKAEQYVHMNLTSHERSFIAQCRFGILPINVALGRFRVLPLENRLCLQ